MAHANDFYQSIEDIISVSCFEIFRKRMKILILDNFLIKIISMSHNLYQCVKLNLILIILKIDIKYFINYIIILILDIN
jgi:hypothetical protein